MFYSSSIHTQHALYFDGFGYGFADVAHGGPRLAGLVGGVRAIRAGDGQLGVVVGDVGVGAGLDGRHRPAWQLVVLLFLLHLQPNGR